MADEPIGMFRKFTRLLPTWIAIIASIATCAGLWLQARDEKPRIDALLVNCERLTAPSIENKLKVSYTFDGQDVKDLWKVRLLLRHAKGQTIVGEGARQNIIGKHIPVKIEGAIEILALNIEDNQPSVLVEKLSQDQIGLSFAQWRAGESLSIVLYLEMDEGQNLSEVCFSSSRAIVDGEVSFGWGGVTGGDSKRQILDYLPSPIALSGRIFLSLFAIGCAVLGLVALFLGIREARRKRKDLNWRRLYRQDALTHLKSNIPDFAFELLLAEGFSTSAEGFSEVSNMTEKQLWKTFKGPPPSSLRLLADGYPNPKNELVTAIFAACFCIAVGVVIIAVSWSV